jgi:hypothetical protein
VRLRGYSRGPCEVPLNGLWLVGCGRVVCAPCRHAPIEFITSRHGARRWRWENKGGGVGRRGSGGGVCLRVAPASHAALALVAVVRFTKCRDALAAAGRDALRDGARCRWQNRDTLHPRPPGASEPRAQPIHVASIGEARRSHRGGGRRLAYTHNNDSYVPTHACTSVPGCLCKLPNPKPHFPQRPSWLGNPTIGGAHRRGSMYRCVCRDRTARRCSMPHARSAVQRSRNALCVEIMDGDPVAAGATGEPWRAALRFGSLAALP